ncbi:MAG: PQQ-binding-like beta-propeller repeat protein, partial [Armatimonadota bacterium]
MTTSARANYPGPAALCIFVLTCLTPLAFADPLPMDEGYAGGRIMPAEQVPVDMTSERLEVAVAPRPSDLKLPYYRCDAHVVAEYELDADRAVTVPVLFPVLGKARDFVFDVNGRTTPIRVVRDTELLAPYETKWREIIDEYVAQDERLSEVAARAKAQRQALMDQSTHTDDRLDDVHIHSRLQGQLRRRLQQKGHPDPYDLSWSLAHEILDAWRDGVAGGRLNEYAAAHIRMTNRRHLALAFDKGAPDPLALWDDPRPRWGSGTSPMSFVTAELGLREGINSLWVEYDQRVGVVSRPRLPDGVDHYESSHVLVSRFEFILRTARFWRSFGDLEVTVELPEGTQQVECSIDEAKAGRDRVTLATEGLPDENLIVDFAAVRWGEAEPVADEVPPGVRRVRLEPVWEAVVVEERGHAHTPPVVDGEDVIVCAGATVGVCDLSSGAERMSAEVEGAAVGVLPWRDRLLVGVEASTEDGKRAMGLVCLHRDTGEQIWSVTSEASTHDGVTARPVVVGDVAVVWAPYRGVMGVDLESGERRWEYECKVLSADADDERFYMC